MNENQYTLSLLSPEGAYRYHDLTDQTINDLSLNYIAEQVGNTKDEKQIIFNILKQMPISRDVIEYRRSIYEDLRSQKKLGAQLLSIVKEMRFYTVSGFKKIDKDATIWDFISRLKELENYCSSILEINRIMEPLHFGSEGLQNLQKYVGQLCRESGLAELMADVQSITDEVASIRSLTIGVNLDGSLMPTEAGLIAMNQFPYREQTILERFVQFHKKKGAQPQQLKPMSMLTHPRAAFGDITPLAENLTRLMETMVPQVLNPLKSFVRKYVDVSGMILVSLFNELLFYVRFQEWEDKLKQFGLGCCIPEISEEDTQVFGFYNLKLAMFNISEGIENNIVTNEMEFSREHKVLILTGPNRGGKTIYTQAIGLAYLMVQHGLFVPCGSGKMKLCDGIYTHFPADENSTVTLGRLGEEAQRLSEICQAATSDSLLLFNESFSSTSHTESVYIAEDIIRYLCCLGASTCYNTHMHELAEKADQYGLEEGAAYRAASLVMGSSDGDRDYKVRFAKPEGKSFAREIAAQYGITFEQLYEKVK